MIYYNMWYFSCNVECQDSCPTTSWSEWSTCKPRHCNENYRIQEGGSSGGIGYQKPSIPGKENMSCSMRHWVKKNLIECAIYFKGEVSHLRIEWKGDFDIQQLVLYLNEFVFKRFVMTNCRRTNISWIYRV